MPFRIFAFRWWLVPSFDPSDQPWPLRWQCGWILQPLVPCDWGLKCRTAFPATLDGLRWWWHRCDAGGGGGWFDGTNVTTSPKLNAATIRWIDSGVWQYFWVNKRWFHPTQHQSSPPIWQQSDEMPRRQRKRIWCQLQAAKLGKTLQLTNRRVLGEERWVL